MNRVYTVPTSTRNLVLVAMCAGLYAFVGYLTYLGVFAIGVGVVRFWPAVFIPAVFSVVFSPWVGGVGAAIGIFISDMLVHGNALLSLTVGVPANFLGFYLMGVIARARITWKKGVYAASLLAQFTPLILVLSLYYAGFIGRSETIVYSVITLIGALAVIASIIRELVPPSQLLGFTVGLMTGSLIIGVGLWAYSQFLILPGGLSKVAVTYSLLWFVWTYYTEIPFLILLAPPIITALRKKLGEQS